MAVAALSTSALALATAPAAPPAPAGEAGAFAQLVSQAEPDGQAPQGEAAPEMIDGEPETTDAADSAIASQETEADDRTSEASVDLLAELEALFAYADLAGAKASPTAMPPAAPAGSMAGDAVDPGQAGTQNAGLASAAAVTMPGASPAGEPNATPLPDAGTMVGQMPAPALPVTPAAGRGAFEAAVAGKPEADVAPAATGVRAEADPASAATTPLRRDIAAIVASLKSAFQPAGAAENRLSPATAAPLADPAPPSIRSPAAAMTAAQPAQAAQPVSSAQPALSTPATVSPAPAAASPTAPAPAPAPAPTEAEARIQAVEVSVPGPEVDTGRTARPPGADTSVPAKIAAADPAHLPDAPAAPAAVEATLSAAAPTDGSPPAAAEMAAPVASLGVAPASASPVVSPQIPVAFTAAIGSEAPLADAGMAPSTPADQSIARQLDLARDTQWLDQLARDISQSVTRQGHLKFNLNPEHLGALTVEIANSAAGTSIKLSAETDQARAIIADAQPRLIAEVRAQGVRVAESHVDLNQQGSGGSAFAQGQQRQSSENSKPFAPTQTVNRDDAGDSAPRDDGELYA